MPKLKSSLWLALLWMVPCLAGQPGERSWDFEKGATGWEAEGKGCGVVAEPDKPASHAFLIAATQPHHTRLVLTQDAPTPNVLISARVKLLEWTGEAPTVYAYGRAGSDGIRAASLSTQGGQILCWYGREQPSRAFGPLGTRLEKGRWVHLALACTGDHVFAKAWPGGSAEPGWQAQGRAPGQRTGIAALGVWTSPRTPSTAKVLFDDVRVVPLTKAMLRELEIDVEPRPPLDVAKLPRAPCAFGLPGRLGLVTRRAAFAFDRKSGDLTNVVDLATGQEFVASEMKSPLFRVVLTKPDAGERIELTARDFPRITVQRGDPGLLELEFGGHARCRVSVTAALLDDETLRMVIAVGNEGEWCVASVAFPLIPMGPALGGDAGDDSLLLPWFGGARLPSPGTQNVSRDAAYPGSAFAQFYAFHDRTAGLYVAMNDAKGHCKRYRLRCRAGQSVSLEIEHLFPEKPGFNAVLPYDVLLRTFRGDWRDAADLYRGWATKQPWCRKRLADCDDVPQFLKDGSGIIITGIADPAGRETRFGKRMEKLPDLMDAYRERTGLKHMVFVPYGWENRGTWAGINYLPTVPGDDIWREVNAELRKRGHRTAFMTSGYWWVVKRQRTSNGPAFDDTADFERRKAMCAMKPDGTPWLVDFYDRTKEHGSWRGLSATLCHGSRDARDALRSTFLRLAALGVPLVSFDQEIGGGQRYPCYGKAHGHPPGHGRWMWTGFEELCAQILYESKPAHPELGLFLENVSELAIPYMSTYWSRQFGEVDCGVTGGRGIGLFSYLYHDYVTAIGAACVQGQGAQGTRPHPWLRCRILANNLVRGLIPGPFMHQVPLEGGDAWTRTVAQAYFAFCKPYRHFPEYLLLGRTVRPLPVESKQVELWFWRHSRDGTPLRKGGRPVVKVPIQLAAVVAGAFVATDGTTATFLVNATPEPQEATVVLPPDCTVIAFDAVRRKLPPVEGTHPRGAKLSLEPFGIRVLLLRPSE